MTAAATYASQRRRLPDGARFAEVSELFALPPEIVERIVVWLGGSGSYEYASGWMRLDTLLTQSAHASHLCSCPASMVVVVAERSEP